MCIHDGWTKSTDEYRYPLIETAENSTPSSKLSNHQNKPEKKKKESNTKKNLKKRNRGHSSSETEEQSKHNK